MQLINCVSVGACGKVLAEFPDVHCPDDRDYVPLLVVAIIVLIYAAAFPTALFVFLRRLHHREGSRANNTMKKTMHGHEAGVSENEEGKDYDGGPTAPAVDILDDNNTNNGSSSSSSSSRVRVFALDQTHDKEASSFWARLLNTQDSKEIARAKFGVFYDHYKDDCWWWEIQVSVCVCVCERERE